MHHLFSLPQHSANRQTKNENPHDNVPPTRVQVDVVDARKPDA